MKYLSALYELLFAIFANLGLPSDVTRILTYVALGAILGGLLIIAPEVVLLAAAFFAGIHFLHH